MNEISQIVETALTSLTKAAEVNTIIGTPIVTADGATVMPVSQVTFAFMAGGGEYGEKPRREGNFAGGSGGGATLTPVGFLVIDRSGVRMIESGGALDKIADAAKNIADAFRGQ